MQSTQQRSRRGFVLGAAVAGAAAAAVASLPATRPAPAVEPAPQPEPPAQGGGYRVTEHVQRYYKSARI